MIKREAISKKLRFEVFKRDCFSCQYCGKKSPEVILHIDHIQPLSKGGKNDILNLITSCQDCNLGKKNILLSDKSIIEKQHKQLAELQEKKEQIEMMLEWKKSLSNLDELKLNAVVDYINKKMITANLTNIGIEKVKKYYKKIDIHDLFEIIDNCANNILVAVNNPKEVYDPNSREMFLNKIPTYINYKLEEKKNPNFKQFCYLRKILINRFNCFINQEIQNDIKKALNLNANFNDMKQIFSKKDDLNIIHAILKKFINEMDVK